MKDIIREALEESLERAKEDYQLACAHWDATGDNTGVQDLDEKMRGYERVLAALDATTIVDTETLGHSIAEYFELPILPKWVPVFYTIKGDMHCAMGLVDDILKETSNDLPVLPLREEVQQVLADDDKAL